MTEPARILVLACEVFHRELCALAARSPCTVDLQFLPKGLHDLETGKMRARLQDEIDRVEKNKYDVITLAYGLCNNGTLSLAAGETPLAIPRAHDCITLFFGSRRRYREYFDANPGTYYRTTGWTERGRADPEDGVMSQLGLNKTYNEYVEKYGKENADYIMRVLGGWRQNYRKLTYIRMPVEGLPDYTRQARLEAAENGWEFELVDGNLVLLEALTSGGCSTPEFIEVPPGCRLAAGADDEVFSIASRGDTK